MLGAKLMKLRRKHGMSQQDVAAALSVSRQTISNWESDASAPDISKAKELAALYRISLSDLVDVEIDVASTKSDIYDEGGHREVDLHVLKSIKGKKCQVVLSPGFWISGSPKCVDVLEVSTDWLRVAYDRMFKGRVTELVDMGSVVGLQLTESSSTSEGAQQNVQQREVENNGCKRVD